MIAKRPCPICEAEEVELLHNQRFELPEGHPLSVGYDVVVCSSCGFVYADTTVTQADYDRFYAEHSKYEDVKTGTGGVENPFDWKRQQETALQIANVLQNTNASILDVGCANGGMLKALKELGFKSLCGIDPSPVCVENTRQLGIEAHQGSLFLSFKENAYDCVILSHTLEHVEDVRGALNWIRERLKTSGIVYIETPDASRYVDFNYAPFQDFNTEHINHFSLACLENLMCLLGFEMLQGGAKTLQTSPQTQYPAVYGFWKQTEIPSKLVRDSELQTEVEKYIQQSKSIMDRIESRLQAVLEISPQIIVWGTGQLAMKLLVETSLAHADILAFVDNNAINHGRVLRNIPIISPNQVIELNAPILIATLLHHHAIAEQIRDMGLKNEIVYLQGD
jgi:2-polyprenyl-3-methyl-5-hydroxy-6-metoxy-1,4-benzoquinol methylase